MAAGKPPKYDRKCRSLTAPVPGRTPAVRFLSSDEGQTIVRDMIRGAVTFENQQLDDLIIQRSDGFPTYNFAVVVDDVTMKISHVIRGDDHLNNTPRQIQLYQALRIRAAGIRPSADDPRFRTRPSSRSATAPRRSPNTSTWAICPRRS